MFWIIIGIISMAVLGALVLFFRKARNLGLSIMGRSLENMIKLQQVANSSGYSADQIAEIADQIWQSSKGEPNPAEFIASKCIGEYSGNNAMAIRTLLANRMILPGRCTPTDLIKAFYQLPIDRKDIFFALLLSMAPPQVISDCYGFIRYNLKDDELPYHIHIELQSIDPQLALLVQKSVQRIEKLTGKEIFFQKQYPGGSPPEVMSTNARAVEMFKQAEKYRVKMDWMEAEKFYQLAVEIDPAFAAAHNNLGFVIGAQGYDRENEAKQYFCEAIRLAPEYGTAKRNLKALEDGYHIIDIAKPHMK